MFGRQLVAKIQIIFILNSINVKAFIYELAHTC